MSAILILNGPNLNLLGVREPSVYGSNSFESYLKELRDKYQDVVDIDYFQSNSEGALIDKLHEVGFPTSGSQLEARKYIGVVFNAGAYTHYSIALHDAIKAIPLPVVETHISNVHQREPFRHHSAISPACKGIVCGFGLNSYRLAIEALLNLQ